MRTAEDILEDMLLQLEQQNGIAQQTAQDLRNANKPSPANVGPGAPNALGDSVTAMGELANNSSTLNDALPVMGGSIKSLGLKLLPGFSTAIEIAAGAAKMFYNYMNDSLNTYKSLNTSGMQASDGMLGFSSSLATGRLTADEFNRAIDGTRDVLASMGNDGSRDFGNMLNTVMKTEESMGALNMTNEQMGKYLASNLKMQKSYGIFDKMTRQEQQESNRQYMDDLNRYSKALGISTDELADKMNKSTDSVTGLGTKLALMGQGMDEEAASKTAENLNMVLASFGDFGDQFNTQFARFLEFGQIDLDSTMGQLYQTNDEIRSIFDSMRGMAKSGELSTEQGAKMIQGMLSRDGLVESLDNSIGTIRAAFDDQAANTVIAMRNQLNNYNADFEKVNDFWGNVTNDFNRSMEAIFFGFKKGIADLFIDPNAFIIDIFGEKWGNWLLNGAFDFDVGEIPVISSLMDFLDSFFSPVAWLWDELKGYGSNVANNMAAIEKPSWEKIFRALVPEWLADIIFDGTEINGAADMAAKITDSLTNLGDDVNDYLGDVSNDFVAHMGNVTDAGMDFIDNAATTISDWWNKPSTQTQIQRSETIIKTQLKPEEIQSPEVAKAAAVGYHDAGDIAKSLEYQKRYNDLLEEQVAEQRRANDLAEKQYRELQKGNKTKTQIN